jgi:hypothetical protein
MTTVVATNVSEAENDKLLGHGPGIQTLRATTFNDLLTSIEVVVAFSQQTGECIGLLGVALEDITLNSPDNTDRRVGLDQPRAAAVVAAEELLSGDA